MKQVVGFCLVMLLCAFLSTKTSSDNWKIEAIISLDNPADTKIHQSLIQEFSKINGVSFCETSIHTNTIFIQFDDKKFGIDGIKHVLDKWECKVNNISYNTLVDFIE